MKTKRTYRYAILYCIVYSICSSAGSCNHSWTAQKHLRQVQIQRLCFGFLNAAMIFERNPQLEDNKTTKPPTISCKSTSSFRSVTGETPWHTKTICLSSACRTSPGTCFSRILPLELKSKARRQSSGTSLWFCWACSGKSSHLCAFALFTQRMRLTCGPTTAGNFC